MEPKISLDDLEFWQGQVMAVLSQHVGEENSISMAELTEAVFDLPCANPFNDTHARLLRKIIDHLQLQGREICSSRAGYWLAETPAEFQKMIAATKVAGLKKLAKAACMSRVGLPEMLGQLALEYSSQAALEAQE